MTATRHGDHVIHCPPSAPSGSRGQASAAREDDPDCKACSRCCFCLVGIAAAITGIVLLTVFLERRFPVEDPVYSAAIAGVAGLDAAVLGSASAGAPLSPVFNLTIRIDNTRNSRESACVRALSTAAVSYGDAPLARGSVPPFCAKKMREREGEVARAWGQGVVLPPFLRDQLAGELAAGEAAVDVKVTMPARCYDCSDVVLSCSKTACVTSLSTATVSYGDAFLGKGSVPEFCAGHRQESEHVVRVWGQDVVVPKFLRDKLAGELAVGEAAVDVKVTMPDWWCSNYRCEDRVLVCKAKIGGGLSPCQFPQKPPIYSVAIASVAGLDPARDLTAAGRTTLSPVWNVTVHINNLRNAYDTECVPSLSTATVSYGDAFLGKGSVPEFCARKRRESERVARVWGQDMVVPRFLRDQLAGELAMGEAAVDVKVTMPNGCSAMVCTDDVLICKAKIGGGLSPCGRTDAPSTKNQA
ncbi:hypothetical protein EJB05_38820, partial [Eragrostis curvula]